MVTDTIADVLTRVRNAQKAGHHSVHIPYSRAAAQLLGVLEAEGFIGSVVRSPSQSAIGFDQLDVTLKYYSSGLPLIEQIQRVSRPGRRVYRQVSDLRPVHCGLGLAVISTSQGVLSDREARRRKIGGEVWAYVA